MAVDRLKLENQLILHEGLKLKAYLDTLGNWTIGVGYNLTGRGVEALEQALGRKCPGPLADLRVTRGEALKMLRTDIDRIEKAVVIHFPEYNDLNEVRQRVIMDMAFNLGFKALSFVNTKAAIIRKDWSMAARHLYRSKWAYQVDDGEGGKFGRADRLVQMLLTGVDYTH